MTLNRPDKKTLIGKDVKTVPMSCQRILNASQSETSLWIDAENSQKLTEDQLEAYTLAEATLCHLAIEAPRAHSSGHPGGPLSAFTFAYFINLYRDPAVDQPLRMSAGHLSLLAYGLEWLFGRSGTDERLKNPESIITTFRTPNGLPGHIEAGIGTIPFGTGPLGKGPSNALGAAYGLKYLQKPGIVDVLMADGDGQEGQVYEAFRLASQLQLDNLVVHGDFNDIQLSGIASEIFASDFAAMADAAGWQVIEVQNGNDPHQVSTALQKANTCLGKGRPIFICYYTTMGNGIALMEEASNTGAKIFHGSPLSDDEAKEALANLPPLHEIVEKYEPYRAAEEKRFTKAKPTVTDVAMDWNTAGYTKSVTDAKGAARKDFGATHIMALMKHDPRIIVLHADLAGSGGFDAVEKAFPNRVLNVGVAEANMYMMAAGMRQVGLLPVTYTFAAFGTNEARANARLIDINCGHTRCAVLHDCTHAGLSVGEDGETHQERNYLNIPFDNTQVWLTADSNQAAAMAEKAMELVALGEKSVYCFFPRDGHEQLKSPDGSIVYGKEYTFDGKATLLRGMGDVTDTVTILATGNAVHAAVAAADELLAGPEKLQVRVLNIACIRPLDAAAIVQAGLETGHLLVVEDHHSEGGLATQVADVIADFSLPCSLRRLGANRYFPSAPAKDLYLMAGIDKDSILDAALDEVHTEVCGGEDAFVSAMSELLHNKRYSRFEAAIEPFFVKLQQEKGYMQSLREFWKNRECPAEKLPSNEDLLAKLQSL